MASLSLFALPYHASCFPRGRYHNDFPLLWRVTRSATRNCHSENVATSLLFAMQRLTLGEAGSFWAMSGGVASRRATLRFGAMSTWQWGDSGELWEFSLSLVLSLMGRSLKCETCFDWSVLQIWKYVLQCIGQDSCEIEISVDETHLYN